jgi:hypothetical protein
VGGGVVDWGDPQSSGTRIRDGRQGAAIQAIPFRIDEARGWHRLAISMNPLDRHAQSALYHIGGENAVLTGPAAR